MTEMLQGYIRAWSSAADDFIALVRELTPDQFALPSDLPGWSVHDVFAHVVALETELATGALPAPVVPIDGRSRLSWWTEAGVAERRDRTPEQLLAEFETALAARRAELTANPPLDPSAPPPRTPAQLPWDTQTLLRNRVIDVWVHDQDIRRAIDRPGDLDTPAARVVIATFLRGVGMILGKVLAAPPGTSVAVILDGRRTVIGVGADGRGAVLAQDVPNEVDVTLTMSVGDFVALCGGRRNPADVEVRVTGDTSLGCRLLDHLTLTP